MKDYQGAGYLLAAAVVLTLAFLAAILMELPQNVQYFLGALAAAFAFGAAISMRRTHRK